MVESEPVDGAMAADESGSTDILQALAVPLDSRNSADPGNSYVAGLYPQGWNAMLKKLEEEATETGLVAKDGDPEQLAHSNSPEAEWLVAFIRLARTTHSNSR